MPQDKGKFFKFYANLPMSVRDEIVLKIGEDPITWRVAYREIEGDTEFGDKIYNKLLELGFIEA